MAENEQAVDQFLKSIMMLRYGSAEGKLGQQRLQMAQQRLNAEQANHAADMQQRANQFGQELALRKQEADAAEKFRQATLEQGNLARQDASQERFRAAGGQLFATPQDKQFELNVTPTEAPNPASILMPKAATQPVGPQPTLEQASMADPTNLPMPQQPHIPIQMTIPAEAQLPDPERYQKTVAPLGTPAGQEAYFPTLKGKVLEQKEAADEANQRIVTPEMERSFGDLGLKAGDKIDMSMLPIMENAATRRLARIQAQNQFDANQITKQNEMDLKAMLGQLALAKKGEGKTISDDQARHNHNVIMNASDPAEAYKSLSPPEKTKEREMLDNEGVGVPSSISAQSKSQETAARQSKQSISIFEQALKDPDFYDAKGNFRFGPVMGRLEDLQQGKVGGMVPFSSDPAKNAEINRKVQQFRSAITYMLFSEGKQLMPGRISTQLIGLLKETSPNPREALPLLQGALDAVKNNANSFLTAAEKERFNGKVRNSFVDNLYPERTRVNLNNDVKKTIAPGMSVNIKGHRIYHDPDNDEFYEVPQ